MRACCKASLAGPQLLPQVLQYLSRLPVGIEEISLSSCGSASMPLQSSAQKVAVGSLAFIWNTSGQCDFVRAENVEALEAAMLPYASDHGFSIQYAADANELVLRRTAHG